MRAWRLYTSQTTCALLLYLVGSNLGAAAAVSFRHSLDRSLLVSIEPDRPSVTQLFDSSLSRGSPDIPADDLRIFKGAAGCAVPEQVGWVAWHCCDSVRCSRIWQTLGRLNCCYSC
jgi:hypothetical protein